ncbi:hypothetical protein ES703_20693 [subsurface metagenome]
MSNRAQRRQAPKQMPGLDPEALAQLDGRSRAARFVSLATMAAARSNCGCDAVRLLNRAIEISMGEALKELEPDAKSDDPPA